MSHEDLISLTFAQVTSKDPDFEASIQTDSALTQQHLEEATNKVTPAKNKPKWPHSPEIETTQTLVCGVDMHHMPLAMTAPHQMTCAMAVANTGTGSKFAGLLLCIMPLAMTAPNQMTCAMAVANTGTGSKFAGLLLWNLYLMWTRTWTAILSPPTSSHMLYVKTHSRASFSTLTSVPLLPHQPLPNGSDWLWLLLQHYTCHWPQQALPCEWICPLSASLTTQSQSSQPRGKPHYSTLWHGKSYKIIVQLITAEHYYAPL